MEVKKEFLETARTKVRYTSHHLHKLLTLYFVDIRESRWMIAWGLFVAAQVCKNEISRKSLLKIYLLSRYVCNVRTQRCAEVSTRHCDDRKNATKGNRSVSPRFPITHGFLPPRLPPKNSGLKTRNKL